MTSFISWNLAHKKPGRFRGLANRRRQWALLAALAPDVAFLQECTPEDAQTLAPTWLHDEYELIGQPTSRWRGSAAILVRRSYGAEKVCLKDFSDVSRWDDALLENIAIARVPLGNTHIMVASVYADARHVVNPALTDADHERLRRPSEDRAWTSDWLAAALDPIVRTGAFLIGGDWNEARAFDEDHTFGTPSATQFFASREEAGWCDVMRAFSDAEVRTYLDSPRPFEIDHFFADAATFSSVTGCRVLDEPLIAELSDHAILTCRLT